MFNEILGSVAHAQGFASAAAFAGTADGALLESIRSIVNTLLGLAALVAVIMIIVGVAAAADAGDNEDAAAKARNNIIFVSLGLIVILLSAVFINFIINSIN